jgi:2-dehydro-3-deoxyphosphogluconate aldolase / (4S)-4-hydroxy-2-oxoglutarate aldolase
MYRWQTMAQIVEQRVFGIVRTSAADEAVTMAELVLAAGLHTVEVALTTPGALNAIRTLTERHPDAVIGAGTVLDAAAARLAIDAGAAFLVSPSIHADVIATAHRYGRPVIPGVATPSEIVQGLEQGADALKLFPASAYSPGWLKDVRAALPQAALIPTGGVGIEDVPHWISAGAVACGMGSALTSGGRDAVRDRMTHLMREL